MQEVVSGFQPKPEDLDYPQKLLAAQSSGDGEIQADTDAANEQGPLLSKIAANGQASMSGVTEACSNRLLKPSSSIAVKSNKYLGSEDTNFGNQADSEQCLQNT